MQPLSVDPTLSAIAQQRAQEIVGNFSHNYWWASQVCWKSYGENLAYSSINTDFVSQWMNSAPHRANILNPKFDQIGTAVYTVGNTTYAVQVFIESCNMQAPTVRSVTPTAPPVVLPNTALAQP
jgi:uncharacterized protein YkwD